jgi:hypothetical protein
MKSAIRSLRRKEALSDFYLAGGTALALHLGHWRSVDLDFFSGRSFREDKLSRRIQRTRGYAMISMEPETLHVQIRGTKVTFLRYAYPIIFPLGSFSGMEVADPREIACMKISAIASRGTRRDFVDLYMAAQDYGLTNLMQAFTRKFAGAHFSMVHTLKSLTFFEDAEKEPMPDMLMHVSWRQIKQFFYSEVPRLL